MPGAVVFGNPHLEYAAETDDILFFGIPDAVDMGGHHSINPEFHLTVERFQCQDIGDLSDVFVVPKQDFRMAGDAKMKKSFHRSSLYCLQDS